MSASPQALCYLVAAGAGEALVDFIDEDDIDDEDFIDDDDFIDDEDDDDDLRQ